MSLESFLFRAGRGAHPHPHRPDGANQKARGPRTPAVCAVLTLTLAAVGLVAVLTAMSASTGLDKAVHLGLWF